MSFFKRKSKYLVKSICTLFGFLVSALIYCEFFHYYLIISQCGWPEIKENSEIVRAMVVADTHLLGSRKGHWFDKLRREWQMHRAFQSTISLHNPDIVLFLGDLFDEGKWCSKEEFHNYVERFNSLFHVPSTIDVLIAAGNHDMGFHYSVTPYLSSRFEEALVAPSVQAKTAKGVLFVAVNSMAMHGDDCFLCKPARRKIERLANELRCLHENKRDCKNLSEYEIQQYSHPILVQHYPLYRPSDALCSESDSAPPEEKSLQFREKWECLSRESTDMLLNELEPRLVLSGHTHHGCRVNHSYSVRGEEDRKRTTLEYTVASFSWRNKVNPTFLMLSASREEQSIYKCHIPDENTVFLIYAAFGICYIFFILRRKIKIFNFLYFKFKESSYVT